ncbi:uncharacterized protein LOC110011965 [Sesamum indicum]|uniref:Uncharacterized protein LOC110011965 n=1 Tax=Sesamum indicum TaxID=4182 RepID=A0A8M8UZC6_SESIN|nr:uncharacterized protein LOC110011965 [Sesamum indicum]
MASDGNLDIYNMIKKRLACLRLRYNTLNRIINNRIFSWLPKDNLVLASKYHWDRISNEIEFTIAYRFKGEPDWMKLQTMFGPKDVEEQDVNLVNISSDDEDSTGSYVLD